MKLKYYLISIISFYLFFYCVYISFYNFSRYNLYKKQNLILKNNIKQIKNENRIYRQYLENAKNPEYSEILVKRKLGYVKQNEVVYQIINREL